jgi:hypothetical protein
MFAMHGIYIIVLTGSRDWLGIVLPAGQDRKVFVRDSIADQVSESGLCRPFLENGIWAGKGAGRFGSELVA